MNDDDTSPLTMDEAVAIANTTIVEETDPGQSATEEVPEGAEADEELQATAEEIAAAEGETEEGDPKEEGQADEKDETEPETESGRYVAHNGRVKLPDGTESTVADLIQGNLRDGDYRQKTMAASEATKAAAAQSQAVKQREAQLAEQAQYVTSLIKSIVPESPPDPAMLTTDPMGYMSQKANYDQWQNHLAYLNQQSQQSAEQAKTEAAQRDRETANLEWDALLGAMPVLKDEAKLKRFASDVQTYGAKVGFKPEELARIGLDHRQAVVLDGYIKWTKLQANKAKVNAKVEGRPPVQKGGARLDPARAKARDTRAAMDRLNQTGSFADGVAAYLANPDNQG